MRMIALVSLAAVALLLGATTAPARLASNRLASNRLFTNKLAAATAAANPLAIGKKLDKHTFAANPAAFSDLMATPEGLELLTFIVSCALPEGTTLLATAPDNSPLEFFGGLGLAKSWLRKPLNAVGRGWVSACLFARTNDHDVTNPLSLRGPHRAFATTSEEEAVYSLEEGAFYGDYFSSSNESIACRGEDEAAGQAGGLADRGCAEVDPADPTHTNCGFIYAGECGDFAAAHTCEQVIGDRHGSYRNCHAQPTIKRDKSRKFKQVITTFVQH